MDKMKFETPDLTSENIEKIAALFPNCVTEMRDAKGNLKHGINFEMLKQMLSPRCGGRGRVLRVHMGGQEGGHCGGQQAHP